MGYADGVNGIHYSSTLHILQCVCVKHGVHLDIFAICLGKTPGVAKAVFACAKNPTVQDRLHCSTD